MCACLWCCLYLLRGISLCHTLAFRVQEIFLHCQLATFPFLSSYSCLYIFFCTGEVRKKKKKKKPPYGVLGTLLIGSSDKKRIFFFHQFVSVAYLRPKSDVSFCHNNSLIDLIVYFIFIHGC